MYHRVLPKNDIRNRFEEPGMIVTPSSFELHLDLIQQYFQPVQLGDWVERRANGDPLPDRACAITFDDGWADNYEFAFPALRAHNIPATIFLVSDLIGTENMFWPERLARLLDHISESATGRNMHPSLAWLTSLLPPDNNKLEKTLDREALSVVINKAKEYGDVQINRHLDEIYSALDIHIKPDHASMLNWEQVREMAGSGLIEMASHTRRHIRLNSSTPMEIMEQEIVSSKAIIEAKTGQPIRSFCFPNGDYSPAALEYVMKTYNCAVTTRSGWNTRNNDMHLLNRISIHEGVAGDRVAFLARVSGWM